MRSLVPRRRGDDLMSGGELTKRFGLCAASRITHRTQTEPCRGLRGPGPRVYVVGRLSSLTILLSTRHAARLPLAPRLWRRQPHPWLDGWHLIREQPEEGVHRPRGSPATALGERTRPTSATPPGRCSQRQMRTVLRCRRRSGAFPRKRLVKCCTRASASGTVNAARSGRTRLQQSE
jgi:hypothetical protein